MTDGEFQKIEDSDDRMYGPKGILVCGYPPPEHRYFALFMDKAGFGDRPLIFPTNADLGKTLKDLLGLATGSGMGESADLPRALILSGFTQKELHRIMYAYRQAGLPAQLWATLTPVSESWLLADLLGELVKENESLKGKK
ncbi:MAG: DUF3783 domain-containing protein [Desulfobacterota bacterium]|jgi:hypothetical protein|nr:DUF3783 domain-containing protein [Thermodesulfobacteriota bacterium]